MAKRKNKKADKPMFDGRIMFDGNIQVRLLTGDVKTLRTDLGGIKLHKADQNKELLILTDRFAGYDEIHTGYIVRSKRYDDCEQPCFGLKHDPDADSWTVLNYQDVIAWGYANGGLNDPTLFYSCQSTVAEEIARERWRAENGIKTHAEKLAEMDAEADDECQDGLVIKFRTKDGNIESETSWPPTKENLEKVQKYIHPTLTNYLSFTHEHPEVKEIHYFTEFTEWDADSDDVQSN